MTLLAAGAIGYVIGSVPYAYIVGRLAGGLDIRAAGSGNVGTTNVLRLSGVGAASAAALLDVAKGAASVVIVRGLGGGSFALAAAGVAAVIGHIYPVWLGFRGGKGVATTIGACLVWSPAAAAIALALFAATVWATRLASLGSLLAAVTVGPAAYLCDAPSEVVTALFVTGAAIVVRHRSNMRRLLDGTERRIGR